MRAFDVAGEWRRRWMRIVSLVRIAYLAKCGTVTFWLCFPQAAAAAWSVCTLYASRRDKKSKESRGNGAAPQNRGGRSSRQLKGDAGAQASAVRIDRSRGSGGKLEKARIQRMHSRSIECMYWGRKWKWNVKTQDRVYCTLAHTLVVASVVCRG